MEILFAKRKGYHGNIGFYSPDVNSDCLVYVELKGDTIVYRSDYHSVPSGYYNVVEMAGGTP